MKQLTCIRNPKCQYYLHNTEKSPTRNKGNRHFSRKHFCLYETNQAQPIAKYCLHQEAHPQNTSISSSQDQIIQSFSES